MARKDDMLRAFLKNQEFCSKYDIPSNPNLTIYKALNSDSKILVTLAKIIDKYEDENSTPLYQQTINILNEK
jgi:hypothetical protein